MASTVITCSALAAAISSSREASCDDDKTKKDNKEAHRIDVHLMDKLRRKPYLQSSSDRIPSTLRILAIDLQYEMRTEAFKNGKCRLGHVFEDGIAPPKVVVQSQHGDDDDNDKSRQQEYRVDQKVLVQSLIQCFSNHTEKSGRDQSVKVEILEASVSEFNPYGLRKTQQVGDIQYDPLSKYGYGDGDGKQEKAETKQNKNDGTEKTIDATEKQLAAPWHQYAWIEELHLRVRSDTSMTESECLDKLTVRLINFHFDTDTQTCIGERASSIRFPVTKSISFIQ